MRGVKNDPKIGYHLWMVPDIFYSTLESSATCQSSNCVSAFYLLKSTFRFLCTKTDGISNAQKIINTWSNQYGMILERQHS